MKLATFLAPGAPEPTAGEVRGDTVALFDPGTTVLGLLASGDRTPAGGPQLAPPGPRRRPAGRRARAAAHRRRAAGAGPPAAGDLRHRPQLRRPRGRDRPR